LEVISLKGLEKLVESKPKNWKAIVVRYLDHKKKYIKKMEESGRDTFYLEMQFVQAIRLAKRFGVVYGRLGD
jgi:hypothetical protein